MTNTPHELAEEFPGQHEAIATLKARDTHFASLTQKYHEANRAVHRAETDVAPTDDLHMAELRKVRLHLKDQIALALKAAV